MLESLHIENIAVIEKSNIDFVSGFNVLTGETGAGKSIIIDAVNTVLGARTSKDMIRSGCKNAAVTAVFSQLSVDAVKFIEEFGFCADEDGKIIIHRTMSLDGKNVFRVNGVPTNSASMREMGKYLINIHGQHDNQALLNPDNHCYFIDKLAENENLINEYYNEFKTLNTYRKELESINSDDFDKERRIELLQYQINELEMADIKVGEYEQLKEQQKICKNFDSDFKRLQNADILLSDDENVGATELVHNAIKSLQKVDNKTILEIYEKISEIYENLADIAAQLKLFIDSQMTNQYNIEEIENRLDLLHTLMLKYGNSESAMLDYLDSAKDELNKIRFSDERAIELEGLLLESQDRLIEKGARLTDSRITAADKFQAQVCEILEFLDMPSVKFSVSITQGKYTKHGCDTVEFLISANAGELVKPLAKIASGGELSRVMLAIKSVLAHKDNVDTLIFDEIDTGISGRAANKVAFQLKKVAKTRQVLCVTHLAQIASCADNHLLISKKVNDDRTYTTVDVLNYDERIKEIARIMSGSEMTEITYNSAKELLDRSLNNANL